MAGPRERAWSEIHNLLPEGWAVAPSSFDPGIRGSSVAARSAKHGRARKPPETIVGEGEGECEGEGEGEGEGEDEDELAALTYLVLALRE